MENIYQEIIDGINQEKFVEETDDFWCGFDLVVKNAKYTISDENKKYTLCIDTPFSKEVIWLIKQLLENTYTDKNVLIKSFVENYNNYVEEHKIVAIKAMLKELVNNFEKIF